MAMTPTRWAVATASVLFTACGARTGLPEIVAVEDAAAPAPEDPCARLRCDDGDPCTEDTCDREKAACVHAPLTFDLDGDGHRGPRPGMKAGAPGACGDDCDDTRASAFPGNKEICDGVDNDCNGVVDDGAQYIPETVGGVDAVRVSSAALQHGYPGGLSHDGARYFADYTGTLAGKEHIFGSLLEESGRRVSPEARLANVESDAYAGPAVWTGDRHAVTWVDRRYDNYEVFLAFFDGKGTKLAPGDVRLSETSWFSIAPSLVWTGREFVVVWQDGTGQDGSFQLYGRRVSLAGVPLGEPVQLTTDGGESPVVVMGRPGLGVTYTHASGSTSDVRFRAFDFDLKPLADSVVLSPGGHDARYASLAWNRDVFVVAWTRTQGTWAVWGTAIDGLGKPVVAPAALSDSPRFARDASMVALGDRLLLVSADLRDQNGGYELYSRTFDAQLKGIGPSARLTRARGDSVGPLAHLGPKGDVAVFFRDDRDGAPQAYFTRLVCRAP